MLTNSLTLRREETIGLTRAPTSSVIAARGRGLTMLRSLLSFVWAREHSGLVPRTGYLNPITFVLSGRKKCANLLPCGLP